MRAPWFEKSCNWGSGVSGEGLGCAMSFGWFGLALSPWLSSISNVDGSMWGELEILGRIVWCSSGEGTWPGSLSGEVCLPLFCGDGMREGGEGWSHMVAS